VSVGTSERSWRLGQWRSKGGTRELLWDHVEQAADFVRFQLVLWSSHHSGRQNLNP
jgi:hypothetical protein